MNTHAPPSPLRRLRTFALWEGSTLLLLVCVAVPLKHLAGWPTGVAVLGPVHGLAFLAYLWAVAEAVSTGSWRRAEVARLLVGALVPFGACVNARWLRQRAAA
jgi:integral membrane protein